PSRSHGELAAECWVLSWRSESVPGTQYSVLSTQYSCGAGRGILASVVALPSSDYVRAVIGAELDDREVEALIDAYAALARGVDSFPSEELRSLEPPLRSIPGPMATAE